MPMLPAATPAESRWRIISIMPGQGQDATGRYTSGKQVTYQLSTGQSGTLFVPDGQDTIEYVKAVVQAAADNLAALHNLTSETPT
jgi:hypothetical protein